MSDFKTVIIRGSIYTNKIGSECKFEFETEVDSDLEGEELENAVEEEARDVAFNYIGWNFSVSEK